MPRDDFVLRKKNKVHRKKLRSESSVSTRVASIIAAKKRRKSGKRRSCEGMCFSLPTLDDPFNDRHNKKDPKPIKEKPKPKPIKRKEPTTNTVVQPKPKKVKANCLSKFLLLCLNAIDSKLLASEWGAEFWKRCSTGTDIINISGAHANEEQIAWVVATAADMFTRREKEGVVFGSPFMLYLVASKEKALQVRGVCKALKELGVHTVSLHTGATVEHQILGLKSCEPEFLVSTPERLLELVSLGAIDISSVSLMVLDGLKSFVDFGFFDKVKTIRKIISGGPQMVVFSDCHVEASMSLAQYVLKEPIYRISLDDSVACQSAFISQYIHIYSSEDDKLSQILQIFAQASGKPKLPIKALLIAGSASKAETVASKLRVQGYGVTTDNIVDDLRGADGEVVASLTVKDMETVQLTNVEEFKIVVFADFPSSIEGYAGILTKIARHSVSGAVHNLFCEADAPLAKPLIELLEHCGQTVPELLRNFDS